MSVIELIESLNMGIIYGFLAMGILMTFRIINFPDLTCDGSFVLGAAISAVLINNGVNPWFALLLSFIGGSIAGFFTSLLYLRFKISELLSGILIAFMLYSINLKVMGGVPNISLLNSPTIFDNLNSSIILIFVFFIIWLIFSYILSTDFGLGLRAIGQNTKLAKSCGIIVGQMVCIGLMFGNGLIGLSGALFTQYQKFVDLSQGIGSIIMGYAALIIGEKIFNFRSSYAFLLAPVLGSVIYRISISLALHSEFLGFDTQELNLVTGLLVILFMNISFRKKNA